MKLSSGILGAGLMCLATACLPGCNGASSEARDNVGHDGDRGFMVKTLQRGFWTRKYGLFVPMSYHKGTTQKYPVIIFLHGVGEGSGLGEGDLKNMTVGIGPAIARKASSFGFIVIFPQSDGGWNPNSDYTEDMFTALANTCREYPVDQDCITLTGLSTGGAGTWAIGAKYNDQFSALVPMGSNGSNPSEAGKLTHLSVRAYCSVFGDIFAGWNDQGMVNRIKAIDPNANAQFIATPTFGHDCWENVYGGDEIYDWMKRQRRSGSHAAMPGVEDQQKFVSAPASPPPAPIYKPAPVAVPSYSRGSALIEPAPVAHVAPSAAPPAPRSTSAIISPPVQQQPVVPAATKWDSGWINTPW